ncbi:unnamed protein product [Adineta ricciae]|uniref:Uncharacterized protein n=1 Tax=Adineta ricciae TaxID=249248 RepID=A0A814Q3E7_ADIRI|nr:unnamed protein product [Adineta ricciae]
MSIVFRFYTRENFIQYFSTNRSVALKSVRQCPNRPWYKLTFCLLGSLALTVHTSFLGQRIDEYDNVGQSIATQTIHCKNQSVLNYEVRLFVIIIKSVT